MNDKLKKFRPIIFDSGAVNWIVEGKNDNDKAFAVAKENCFLHNDNTCAFCGFKATKTHISKCGLEVFHIDGDGLNNKQENIVPACPYCRMCMNLSYAEEEGATLVWLPELEQHEISHLYRIYFLFKNKKEDLDKMKNPGKSEQNQNMKSIFEAADKLNANILERAHYAERIIGTSKPGELGRVIESIKKTISESSEVNDLFKNGVKAGFGENGEEYKSVDTSKFKSEDTYGFFFKNRASILSGIRLIPRKIAFSPNLGLGSSNTNYKVITMTWLSRAEQILKEEQEFQQ